MRYSPEKKAEAMARMAQIGVLKTSEELNITTQTLYKWRNEENSPEAGADVAPQIAPVSVPAPAKKKDYQSILLQDKTLEDTIKRLENENAVLRSESAQLRQTIAQLKKAMVTMLE